MHKKLPREILDRLDEFAVNLSLIESLSRILHEQIKFDNNLEKFDAENLSNVLKQKIMDISKDFRLLNQKLEFPE